MLAATSDALSPAEARLAAIRRHLGPYLNALETDVWVRRTLDANSPLVSHAAHAVPGVMLTHNVAYLPPSPGTSVGGFTGDSYALLRTGALVRLSVRGWWDSTERGYSFCEEYEVHEDAQAERLDMAVVARFVAAALVRARAPLAVARAAFELERL